MKVEVLSNSLWVITVCALALPSFLDSNVLSERPRQSAQVEFNIKAPTGITFVTLDTSHRLLK